MAEVPAPEPGPGEVLLNVTAAGVNRADLLQRRVVPAAAGASELLGSRFQASSMARRLRPAVRRRLRRAGGAVPLRQVMTLPPGGRSGERCGNPRGRMHRVLEPGDDRQAAARRNGC